MQTFGGQTKNIMVFLILANWESLEQRRFTLKRNYIIKILNGKNLFKRKERTTSIELRDDENKLVVPFPRTNCFKQSLTYSGAILWNDLPNPARNAKFFDVTDLNCSL